MDQCTNRSNKPKSSKPLKMKSVGFNGDQIKIKRALSKAYDHPEQNSNINEERKIGRQEQEPSSRMRGEEGGRDGAARPRIASWRGSPPVCSSGSPPGHPPSSIGPPPHDAKDADADADREGKGWGKPDSNGGSSGSSGWTCRTASGRHDRRSRSLRCRPENGDSVARFASSAIAAAVSAIQSSKRRRREKGPWLPVRTSKM
ncbi:hypothetical protein GW17_00033760 [Ensete ventricosum]|nr:hypothetical protein GW17_00033760 [Ensete ventricosum]